MRAGRINILLIAIKYAVILILALISLFPILVLILTSFKTQADALSIPPRWFFAPTLENYHEALFEENFFRYLSNSLIVALTTTGLTIAVSVLAAYSLTRQRYLGRRILSITTLIFQMISPAVIVVPIYILWQRIGLSGTLFGLIIVYAGLNIPFAIWILKTFIAQIPVEVDEAAIIDGCSNVGILFKIVFPLILPGVAAASVFIFRLAWNEFLIGFILTNRFTRTLPVAISLVITDYGIQWGKLTAMGTIVAVPALLFTFIAARQLIQGLTAGAVKY